MNAIKALLTANSDILQDIIESYGFCNIKQHKDVIKFAFDEDSKGSCVLNVNTLQYTRWSDDTHGDIFTAIMNKTGMSFKDTIQELKGKLNLSDIEVDIPTNKKDNIFQILNNEIRTIMGQNVYTQYDINRYEPIISTMFRRDGINIATQCEFDIRYDDGTDRIVIFWKDIDGKIVGNTARANWKIKDGYPYKYLSLMPFNKREHLFGLYENKEFIQKSGYCVLVEAEKSTLQAHSFDFRSMCSLGMSHIDKKQIDLLYGIGIRNIILAYDEDKHIIEYLSKKSDINKWYPDVQVYAIYDKEKKYLKLGSKNSPTDLGRDVFEKLFKECLIKI